jgi:hypothetical protein
MEYMTPLIYQKILDAISYVYKKSTDDEKYDLFRLKDILDSFSKGQHQSKLWAVEELNKIIDDSYNECFVIGSWYGLFSHLFAESGFKNKIVNIEIDDFCNKIARKLKIHDNIIYKTADGLEDFKNWNYHDKILVCTACEHIDEEELFFVLKQKNPSMLMCLQSNNYYEINSHINCHNTLEDFIKSLPLENILYAGEKRHKDEYDRFMVIGK